MRTDTRQAALKLLHEMNMSNLEPELMLNEYDPVPQNAMCLCPDILEAFPVASALIVARDTIDRAYHAGVGPQPLTNERFSRAFFAALFFRYRTTARPDGRSVVSLFVRNGKIGAYLVEVQ